MGGRARPPSIRPQRLIERCLKLALWRSGALGQIGGPRSPAFELREPSTGKQRYGGFVMEYFQRPGRWLMLAHAESEGGGSEEHRVHQLVRRGRPRRTKLSYEELQRHECCKTYCPPKTQLFSASGAVLKTLSGAKCKQGCQAHVRAAAGRKAPPAQDSQDQKQAAEPADCRRGTANR